VALVPIASELEKEYLNTKEFMGHHSQTDDYGFPEIVSFNIKMHGVRIPTWVSTLLDKNNLQDAANDDYESELSTQLQMFVEDLQAQYDFLGDWYQEGRSGGWLAIKIKDVEGRYDGESVMNEFELLNRAFEETEDWALEDFDTAYYSLMTYINALKKRLQDLSDIEMSIGRAKKGVEERFGSNEYWVEFFGEHGISVKGKGAVK
jgi:hypothetical protein